MPKKVYIALGNHRSFAGIKEIVYTLRSALSQHFSVELSRELKSNSVNIVIDEFSAPFDVSAITNVKALYPKTKIVIVATEFATPVSVLGIKLIESFNFFGSRRDWGRLLLGMLRSLAGGMPPYMLRRYVGFARAIKDCDLLTTIHPCIVSKTAELGRRVAPNLPAPLLIYPLIGPVSNVQQDRLRSLPVGFAMTGTLTPYRAMIMHRLVEKFKSAGWSTPLYEYRSFEAASPSPSPAEKPGQSDILTSLLEYNSICPKFLFNVNPPQSAKWAYSSPMRILRAVVLGQIPVITKRFSDHPLEKVATLWDGRSETVFELASRQFVDRRMWLTDYLRSIEAYDREAKETNQSFVSAIHALAESSESPMFAIRERAAL